MSKPDFIIIGTMKGGTTALYDFIAKHPRVVRAANKEIHYFSLNLQKGDDWYYSQFNKLDGQITGEASPTYFDICYTGVIPNLIKTKLPQTKIILIVRNPVERAISHYRHFCKVNKIQDLIDTDINKFFEGSFLDAPKQLDRMSFYLNQILSFSSYYRKFLYFNEVYDNDQFLILTNDALKNNSKATMGKVFDFLSISDYDDLTFDEFKYSTGSNLDMLTPSIKQKLEDYLLPDYELFHKALGARLIK